MRRLLVVLILACASVAWAQSPCDGRITDKLNHAMSTGAVVKPAAGETYVDPVFGTFITRITNANPAEGTNAVITTTYSTLRGWNSDGSMIVAWHRAALRTYEFYQGDKPYSHLGQVVFGGTFSDFTWPSDIEQIIWDTTNPNVMYYPAYDGKGGRGHPLLMKLTLNWPSAPTVSIVRDFATECAAQGVALNTLSLGSDPMDMSFDVKKLVGLECGSTSSGQPKYKFLYSIADDAIKGGYVSNVTYDFPPFPCSSGACAYRERENASGGPIFYNNSMAQIGAPVMVRPVEHSAMGYTTSGGFDFVMQSTFDEQPYSGPLMYWKVNGSDTTPFTLIGQENGWPYTPSSTHPSLSAKDGSGWVAVGMVGDGNGQTALSGEIAMGNVGTGDVCRVAHHRTYRSNNGCQWGYWSETHPQISNDGYRILFNSDWLCSNTVDMYVIDLRPQDTTILTSNLPSGVTTEAYSAALGIGGGTGPYTCSKTVGSYPTGLSLTGCTISGTPTTVESQTFTIEACDSTSPTPQCDTQELTIQIRQRPSITTGGTLPAGDVGSAYSTTLAATGGTSPYTYSVASGSLCEGLSLSSAGTISGTCVRIGTYNFTVQVTSAYTLTNTKAFSMVQSIPSVPLCARLDPIPGSSTAVARMSGSGIPYNASCWVDVRDSGGSLLTTVTATGSPVVQLTGLTPSTTYLLDGFCDDGPPHLGVATYTASRRTLTTQAASMGTVAMDVTAKIPAYAKDLATAQHGSTSKLGFVMCFDANCSSDYACVRASACPGDFCTVSKSLASGVRYVWSRWSWLPLLGVSPVECGESDIYASTAGNKGLTAIP